MFIRSCLRQQLSPSTPQLSATPAVWLPLRPPTLWHGDSLSSQPKRWPTPQPTLSKRSRSTPQLIKTLSVNLVQNSFVMWEAVIVCIIQTFYRNTNTHSYVVVLFQALDGDFSEENRNKCRVATTPLLEAVENLSAFANNPEFASIPAQISNEV